LTLFAWYFRDRGNVLTLAFQIVSYTYGGLLGVFLVGLLTKRGRNVTNIIAMVTSVLIVRFLNVLLAGLWSGLIFLGEQIAAIAPWFAKGDVAPFFGGVPEVAWHWMIIIGTVWTFGFAVIFAGKPKANEQAAG
jgi:hypothetical protein